MSNQFNAGRKRSIKQKKFDASGGMCEYCHIVFPYERLTLDHLIPRKQGGRNSSDNLVLACEPCNQMRSSKNLKALITWIMRHMEYTESYAIGVSK